jgi:hypothetical protein
MRKDQAGIWNEPQEYGPEIRSLDAIVINAHEEMEWYQRVISSENYSTSGQDKSAGSWVRQSKGNQLDSTTVA